MPPLFEPSERGSAVVYGACAGVWVMLMYAPPIASDMHLARPSLTAMQKKHPAGFPTLTWVMPTVGYKMDAETRAAASTITDEYVDSILAQATLIEGAGFQSAAVRAIVAGIDLMTRSRSPKKVFAEILPCVEWCLAHRPKTPASTPSSTPAEVASALDALRRTVL